MFTLKGMGLTAGVAAAAWFILALRAQAWGWCAVYAACAIVGVGIFVYRHRQGN